ncbi:MAG TPA: carboxypeptidase-like regulatory domain-containing protein [Dongiaceae bacterium]|nr:carboxypeptidase-like regulatory domain-containing protein [Dongiaceae bacterium]
MGRRFWMRAMVCTALLGAGRGVRAQQFGEDEKFTLRGHVVSAVTAEPVSGALVVLIAGGRQAQFSAADGTFEFSGLLRGRYMVEAKKPGYFSDRELGLVRGGMEASYEVPAEEDATVKLTPEGVIYGRVEDEKGRALEGIQVQAERWIVSNGTRQLLGQGQWVGPADDEGNFRIAELPPGEYFLKFSEQGGVSSGFRSERALERARTARNRLSPGQQGFGTQYYPGVADAATANTIHVRPGAPVQIQQKLERLRLYEVSGVVRGAPTESGFNVMLMAGGGGGGGGEMRGRAQVFPSTGEFRIEGVPAGRYLLQVSAQEAVADRGTTRETQLVAQTTVQVNGDISGLGMVLGHGSTLAVQVRDERAKTNEGPAQVQVTLQSPEFPNIAQQFVAPPPTARGPRGFENVASGTYSVEAFTFGQGYVASLRCAGTDLLKEELKVESGTSLAPIEVRVRSDGAELTASAVRNGKPVVGRVVIYSEEYPKRSMSRETFPNSTTWLGMFAPGTYKLIATPGLAELEYKNPAGMAKYLANATSVTLAPDTQMNLQVEVQDVEPEP